MPACSCNGANPECCYCGGWGWIGDSVQPSPQAHHIIVKGLTPTQRTSGARSQGMQDYYPRPPIIPTRNTKYKCPICGALRKNLEDHTKKKHAQICQRNKVK